MRATRSLNYSVGPMFSSDQDTPRQTPKDKSGARTARRPKPKPTPTGSTRRASCASKTKSIPSGARPETGTLVRPGRACPARLRSLQEQDQHQANQEQQRDARKPLVEAQDHRLHADPELENRFGHQVRSERLLSD